MTAQTTRQAARRKPSPKRTQASKQKKAPQLSLWVYLLGFLAFAGTATLIAGLFFLAPAGKSLEQNSNMLLFLDDPYLPIGEEREILFTAEILNEDGEPETDKRRLPDDGKLAVYEGNKQIAVLTATDEPGIYQASCLLRGTEQGYRYFTARWGNQETAGTDSYLFSYEELTEADWQQHDQIMEALGRLGDTFRGENGYVAEEQTGALLDQAEILINEEQQKGNVAFCERTADSIYFELQSGIGCFFIPPQEGVLSGSDDDSDSETGVIAFIPFLDSFAVDVNRDLLAIFGGMSWDDTSPSASIQDIRDFYHTRLYQQSQYLDESVNPENLQLMKDYHFVLWEGHGAYAQAVGSALVTGMATADCRKDSRYSGMLLDKAIVTTKNFLGSDNTGSSRIAITSLYVRQCLTLKQGTIVYLGACHSLEDDRLAQAFLTRGASSVVGYDGAVDISYEIPFRMAFAWALSQPEDDGSYRSVKEATETAALVNGASDSRGTTAVIRGQSHISLQTICGRIKGTVTDEDGKPVANAVISLYHQKSNMANGDVYRLAETSNYTYRLSQESDGSFYSDRILPRHYYVTVSAPGYGIYQGEFTLQKGKTTDLGQIRLEKTDGVGVTGEVWRQSFPNSEFWLNYAVDGIPQETAAITISNAATGEIYDTVEVGTRFKVTLPAGQWNLTFSYPECKPKTVSVTVDNNWSQLETIYLETDYEGVLEGSGTAESPYLISDAEDLNFLARWCSYYEHYEGLYFRMTNDIYYNDTSSWQDWESQPPANIWLVIGGSKAYFGGNFDGGGYAVYGLYSSSTQAGFFGHCGGNAVISNLTIRESLFDGDTAGAITPYASGNAQIINCCNEGTVTGSANAGGIVGYLKANALIQDCRNLGAVTATGPNAGGITGEMDGGSVNHCVNDGSVSTSSAGGCAGGICGFATVGYISDCVNNGIVNGITAGGICGIILDGYILDCANTVTVYSYTMFGRKESGICGSGPDEIISGCNDLSQTQDSSGGTLPSGSGTESSPAETETGTTDESETETQPTSDVSLSWTGDTTVSAGSNLHPSVYVTSKTYTWQELQSVLNQATASIEDTSILCFYGSPAGLSQENVNVGNAHGGLYLFMTGLKEGTTTVTVTVDGQTITQEITVTP